MLDCLGARVDAYEKDRIILAEGDPAKYLGIVLTGRAQVVRMDYYGNRSLVASIEPPELFAESFACSGVESMPVSVVAAANTEVMLIEARRVMTGCSCVCGFHMQMIQNLLQIVARKNLVMHQKIQITSQRSTRQKLMTYLLMEAKRNKSNRFAIPYDRQELADYLEIDRSGLSAELSRLRAKGVLACRKNQFILL